jgi:hypothetical protein
MRETGCILDYQSVNRRESNWQAKAQVITPGLVAMKQ